MKPTTISAEALFEAHRQAMRWEWIAGHAHPERHFDDDAVRDARSPADLVGYLNYIHPYRVQIVGRREVAYLLASAPDDQERRISRIVTLEPPVLIVADDQVPPRGWWRCATAPRSRCSRRPNRPAMSSTWCAPTWRSCLPSAPRATACSWTSSAWAC